MGQVKIQENLSRDKFVDDWSNDACCGYTLKALKNSRLPDNVIEQILTEMKLLFTEVEVAEAQDIFCKHK